MSEKTSKKRVRILTHLLRHNRLEHMRPMLVKFPLSRSFGICKADVYGCLFTKYKLKERLSKPTLSYRVVTFAAVLFKPLLKFTEVF